MKNMGEWTDVMELSKDIDGENDIKKCLLKREKVRFYNMCIYNLTASLVSP